MEKCLFLSCSTAQIAIAAFVSWCFPSIDISYSLPSYKNACPSISPLKNSARSQTSTFALRYTFLPSFIENGFSISCITSGGCSQVTTTSLVIAAFSLAICSIVLPKIAQWSSPIGVMTASSLSSMALVASHLPPSPVSSTHTSHSLSKKASIATAVSISNAVGLNASSPKAARKVCSF